MHSFHCLNKVNVLLLSLRVSIPEPLHGIRRNLVCNVCTNICQVNFIWVNVGPIQSLVYIEIQ
jgi:hypothetical protein